MKRGFTRAPDRPSTKECNDVKETYTPEELAQVRATLGQHGYVNGVIIQRLLNTVDLYRRALELACGEGTPLPDNPYSNQALSSSYLKQAAEELHR
jgi:hypothetical protein